MWIAADVAVLRRGVLLVGRGVFEQLDVRAEAAAHQRDLLDHRLRIDAEQVLHEGALVVGERAERHRLLAADHLGEEIDRLLHVGHGDAGVVVAAHAGDGVGGCGAGAGSIVAAAALHSEACLSSQSPPSAGRCLSPRRSPAPGARIARCTSAQRVGRRAVEPVRHRSPAAGSPRSGRACRHAWARRTARRSALPRRSRRCA